MFVVLGFLLAAQNTYVSTMIASQFLARVGAKGIPLYYVLNAATSIPFAALFSGIIDRFPRRQVFIAALGIFTVITALFPVLPSMGSVMPYVNYLLVRVVEHLLYSVYYILVADYFTVTDNKRHAGKLALGMAVGGLTGGVLLTAATAVGGPLFASWLTPFTVAAAMVYAGYMTKRQQPIDAAAPASPESIAESLRILPQLMRRYPLIALMSAAMFLNILLQCMAEFLAFSIYTAHFPRVAELTVFLGTVNAGLSLLGFVVIVAFTGRQLPRLGVPKMNRVYPTLDVITFSALTLFPSLPTGILANISYDPFEHGIDVPVTTLNYNAIRHRFVGRVRVFIDGMVFPLGLAAAGLLLLVFAGRVELRVVAACGLGLSLVLLVLQWNIGKQYARGLVEMLRDGAVELDQVESGLRLTPDNLDEIRAMLAGDPRNVLIGLEMAARCDGAVPADAVAAALAKLPTVQARRALADLATNQALVDRLAEIGAPEIRQLAWEHKFSHGGAAAQARALAADPDEGVRCIAAAALLADDPGDPAARGVLGGHLSSAAAIGALEVLGRAKGNVSATLLALGAHPDPGVRAAALAAARNCAADAPAVLAWAWQAADDPEPAVRQRAAELLAGRESEPRLPEIAEKFFNDPLREVRDAAASALGARGAPALPAICGQLRGEREEAQVAAIDALGIALGAAAPDRLFDEMRPQVFDPIAFNRRLGRTCPAADEGGLAIRAALDNAARRTYRLVMHALAALGHRRTLDIVRTMMNSSDPRSRASAIESLESLPQRRFVIPILPLIEDRESAPRAAGRPDPGLVEQALLSPDPWLRAAAAVAVHARTGAAPAQLLHDASPIVGETVRGLAQRSAQNCSYPQDVLMNRLAFLHGVRLFADTSLDDLIAVDQVLRSEAYLAGEPIVSEGEVGDRLCIIHSGAVEVTKGGHVLARLAPGDFFGEMALFDDEPRSATVTAQGDVEVLSLERDRFHSLVRQRPGILMEVCATLVRRLRQTEQDVAAAGLRRAQSLEPATPGGALAG